MLILRWCIVVLLCFSVGAAHSSEKWRFYDSGYASKSGTTPIHQLKVALPDCEIGNVCNPNRDFSVQLPSATPRNANKFSFFANDNDVTMLLYYDEKTGIFRIKEYYQKHLFKNFTPDTDNIFAWRSDNDRGSVRILLGDKTLEGKTWLKGQELTLHFAGSDTIPPHKYKIYTDEFGKYSAEGLATLDYTITAGAFPIDNPVDMLIIYDDPLRPGEFVVINKDRLKSFTQIAGDPVIMNVQGSKVAMILPYERNSESELVFSGEMRGGSFMLSMPHPVPLNKGYEHFKIFDTEGIYALTKIANLPQGGVLTKTTKHMPKISINSIVRMYRDSVKVHLYNDSGKATDITDMFRWNDTLQTMEVIPERYARIYALLHDGKGVLAGTFCDRTRQDRCFRIKQTIRAGSYDITVSSEYGDYIILREIGIAASQAVVRTAKPNAEGTAYFRNIPTGVYQAEIADLNLKHRGYAIFTVPNQLGIKLKPDGGELIPLFHTPLELQKNDFIKIDLRTIIPNLDSLDSIQLLGDLPAEYHLYDDNILTLLTKNSNKNTYSVILLGVGAKNYQLPLFYKGGEESVVTEKGADYTMCPSERPLCGDAFVHIKGARHGIYDGKIPLSFTFPISFGRNDIRVFMGDSSNVTQMFHIYPERRTITLKRDHIPGFLSALAGTKEPITIRVRDRTYYAALRAGYKVMEVSVVDHLGAEIDDVDEFGFGIKISCRDDKYFSQIEAINSGGMATFENLPDCLYTLSLIDKSRLFQGEELDIALFAGQSRLHTLFRIKRVDE